MRRLLDGVVVPVPHRATEPAGRVIAERRNDLVKNCRVHPAHWLISTQAPAHAHDAARAVLPCRRRQQRGGAACEEQEHRLHDSWIREMRLSTERRAGRLSGLRFAKRAHQIESREPSQGRGEAERAMKRTLPPRHGPVGPRQNCDRATGQRNHKKTWGSPPLPKTAAPASSASRRHGGLPTEPYESR